MATRRASAARKAPPESEQSGNGGAESGTSRRYISQTDVPAYSLEQALRVPFAIADNYGKSPTRPLRVAEALNMAPGSSTFRMLCGASIAYGLTEGGYNAELIALTVLGRRIVAPTREGDDEAAKREATLRPRILRDFLTRYNGSKFPTEVIGRNVLEEIGVPADRTVDVYRMVIESARAVGFLRDVKGSPYVDLDSAALVSAPISEEAGQGRDDETGRDVVEAVSARVAAPDTAVHGAPRRTNRVFITHGKNQEIVTQLKDLLTFGGFTPVVAIENETVSKPVPEKVLDDMRSCDAAVIHVGGELRAMDPDGKELRVLNQNVLIEIGAAMALYGRKFILLVEKGATLPSNLQGLYEVRYDGGRLDYDSTMRLLKAFNDFRS